MEIMLHFHASEFNQSIHLNYKKRWHIFEVCDIFRYVLTCQRPLGKFAETSKSYKTKELILNHIYEKLY